MKRPICFATKNLDFSSEKISLIFGMAFQKTIANPNAIKGKNQNSAKKEKINPPISFSIPDAVIIPNELLLPVNL